MEDEILDEPFDDVELGEEKVLNSHLAYHEMKKAISYLCVMFTVSGLAFFSGFEILIMLGGVGFMIFFFMFIIALITSGVYSLLSLIKGEENTKEKWLPFLGFFILMAITFCFYSLIENPFLGFGIINIPFYEK